MDHRIRLSLGDGGGPIQLSYFTGGLEISPEAVVTLKKTKQKSQHRRTYVGILALFLRTQNNTATEFVAANLRLSMSRVGIRGRRRRMAHNNKSMAFESVALRSSGEDHQTALGPIEVFEYRGVKIPMGSNYTWVINTPLKLEWTLQYNISDTFATQPDPRPASDRHAPGQPQTVHVGGRRHDWVRCRRDGV